MNRKRYEDLQGYSDMTNGGREKAVNSPAQRKCAGIYTENNQGLRTVI